MTLIDTILKSSKTSKRTSADAYGMPPELLAAIAGLNAALAAREQFDQAVARNTAMANAAMAAQSAADANLAAIETHLALEFDESKSIELEGKSAELRQAKLDAAQDVATLERRQTALHRHAAELDGNVAAARRSLETQKSNFAFELNKALRADLIQAMQHLAPVLARAQALREIGIFSWTSPLLSDALLPSPVHGEVDPLRGSKIVTPTGDFTDIAETWREHAGAVAMSASLASLREAIQRAGRHEPFKLQNTSQSAYVPDWRNAIAGEHNAKIDAAEQAEADGMTALREENRAKSIAPVADAYAGLSHNQRASLANRPIELREEAERQRLAAERHANFRRTYGAEPGPVGSVDAAVDLLANGEVA